MKRRANGGFTLLELLCAIIVLLLLAALLTLGVRTAVTAFGRSMAASEAQTLLSTLRTGVSDELRYSGTVRLAADGTPAGFFSRSYGEAAYSGFSSDERGHVLLGVEKLLPDRAYPHGLRAEVKLTAYDAATGTFTVQITVYTASAPNLAQTEFETKQLNPAAILTE